MNKGKLCPLSFNSTEKLVNCQKDGCAWWITTALNAHTIEKGCCMAITSRIIFDINSKIR